MLTKEKRNKFRMIKYMAMIVALVAVFVLCLTACGKTVPTKVEVTANPTKTAYNQGETFDYTGAKVKVTYDNGKTEEIDVTAEMVGTIVFDTAGQKTVVIRFTAEGKTVETTLKVEVTDPNAAKKVSAISELRNSSIVTSNPADNGLANLLNEYIAAINAETSEDGINNWVTEFYSKANTYMEKKNEYLAMVDVDAVIEAARQKISQEQGEEVRIFDKYRPTAESACTAAQKKIKAAANLEEALSYVDEAKDAVYQYLKVQVYVDKQLNEEKIALLTVIEYYQSYGTKLVDLLEERELEVDAIVDPVEKDRLSGLVAAAKDKYNAAVQALKDVYHYILITEDLSAFTDKIADALTDLVTPMDLVCLVLSANDFVIVPAAYVENADGTYSLGTDDVALDIARMEALIAETEELFGTSPKAQKLLTEYVYTDEEGVRHTANLVAELAAVKAKYETRKAAQDAAVAVINAINAATAEGATDADLTAAWDALQTWGNGTAAYDAMLTSNTTILMVQAVTFDKVFAGNYTFPATFEDYDMDQTHIITYYIYNFEDLLDATAKADAKKVEEVVNKIGQIIYTTTDSEIDTLASIVAAETAIANYKTVYGEEAYLAYCGTDGEDTLGALVAEKRAAYEQRVADAEKILELIEVLKAKPVAETQIEDYAEESNLRVAYEMYVKFLAENTLEADTTTTTATYVSGTVFSDVLDAERAELTDRVKEYVKKSTEDARVLGVATLSVAFKTHLADFSVETQAALREQLKDFYLTKVGELNALDVTVAENALGTDLVFVDDAYVAEADTVLAKQVAALDAAVAAAEAEILAFPPVVPAP